MQQKVRLERINAKSQERLQRRQDKAQQVRQMRPSEPKGLLAPLKQSGYQRDYDGWLRKDYAARILFDAAERLDRNLRSQENHSRFYALNKLERIDPAFAQRVQHYRQQQEQLRQQQRDRLRLEKQRAERDQKPEQDRGISREHACLDGLWPDGHT